MPAPELELRIWLHSLERGRCRHPTRASSRGGGRVPVLQPVISKQCWTDGDSGGLRLKAVNWHYINSWCLLALASEASYLPHLLSHLNQGPEIHQSAGDLNLPVLGPHDPPVLCEEGGGCGGGTAWHWSFPTLGPESRHLVSLSSIRN